MSEIKHENIIKMNNMPKKYYAHSLEGKPPSDWQPLEEHLKNVAEMARSFSIALTVRIEVVWWGYGMV